MYNEFNPWFLINGILMMTFFVLVPWIVIAAINPGNHLTINYAVSDADQLATCQENNQQILDQRDVYCVKEFGRPDNTWEWILSSTFLVLGIIMYGVGFWKSHDTDKRGEILSQRAAELTKRENAIATREQELTAATTKKRGRR